jgi:hypothetical protein
MPMACVPLELQMSELRLHNMNIISKEELMTLNQRNEDLKLKDDNIEYFLNVQHSMGKILYLDNQGLDHFIILQFFDFRVVFFPSIYKEYVVVYYAVFLFVIFKYFSEIVDQLLFPIFTFFLWGPKTERWQHWVFFKCSAFIGQNFISWQPRTRSFHYCTATITSTYLKIIHHIWVFLVTMHGTMYEWSVNSCSCL